MKFYFVFFFSFISFISLAQQQQNNLSIQGDFQNFSAGTGGNFNSSSITSFTRKGETIGSQFLFNSWVKGNIVNQDSISYSDGVFNFDKINQYVYLKRTNGETFQINQAAVKSITLTDGDKTYIFEHQPAISKDKLYINLIHGGHYSLYGYLKTKFIAANYFTNGIATSGNNYDEFKDEIEYYIVSNGQAHTVSLKKKSVKAALENESSKLDVFFKENGSDITEAWLTKLVLFLNQ